MSTLPLHDKVAVVTGASSGIGQAVAIRLAEAGCNVGLIARREEKLKQLVLSIAASKLAGSAVAATGDVTKRNSVRAAVSKIESKFGHTDILVNCAGVMYYTLMKNLKEKEWEEQVDVNCKGILNSIGGVLPHMVERRSGHIVNISSNAGIRPFPGLSVYTGTKYFVEGLSQSMRLELAESKVKVTCIQPGDVDTAAQDMSTDSEASKKYSNLDRPNMLHVDDVARTVVFAVSQPEGVGVNTVLVEPLLYPA